MYMTKQTILIKIKIHFILLCIPKYFDICNVYNRKCMLSARVLDKYPKLFFYYRNEASYKKFSFYIFKLFFHELFIIYVEFLNRIINRLIIISLDIVLFVNYY